MKKNGMKPAKIGAIFLVAVMSMAAIGAGYAHWQETLTISGVMTTDDIYPYFYTAKSNDPLADNGLDPTDCGQWFFGDNGWSWDGIPRDKNVGSCDVLKGQTDKELIINIADAYPCYYAHPMFIIKNKGSCPVLLHTIQLLKVSYKGIPFVLDDPVDLVPNQWWGVSIKINEGVATSVDIHQPVDNAADDFSLKLTGNGMIINKQVDPESWGDGTGHMDTALYCDELQGDICIHFENGCRQDVEYDFTLGMVFYNWPEDVECPTPGFTNIDLESSTDESTWIDVMETTGVFYLDLDENNDYYYLDLGSSTATNTFLAQDVYFPFYLDITDLPADFYTYWSGRGVFDACTGTYEPIMWEIIADDGPTLPMFYIKYDGSDYMLIDGLQYELFQQYAQGQQDNPLRVNGEYPTGEYLFTGYIGAACGMTSNPINVAIEFA